MVTADSVVKCAFAMLLTSPTNVQPFESVMPIINNPSLNPNKPLHLEIIAKVSELLQLQCRALCYHSAAVHVLLFRDF